MGNSALGRGTAIEENKVKASSGDATPGFLDAKVDNDTMIVNSNLLESVNEFDVGGVSRATSIASGTQAITGVGFVPKAVIFFMADDGALERSFGMDQLTDRRATAWTEPGSFMDWATGSIQYRNNTPSSKYEGQISSFDSDGFTITWTKTGSPTATITIFWLAFK
jgi:hypothetical protein